MQALTHQEKVFSLIDLTSLNDNDTEESIRTLCQKAISPLGQVAAICVYPKFVKVAVDNLDNKIPVAAVANFPKGNDALSDVLATIQQAIDAGAREIDVVFPYQLYCQDRQSAFEFIRACKKKNIILKVILESGAISDPHILADISQQTIAASADFLKTSTGKIAIGATIESATIMLQAIKDSGKNIGFKASGGIRTLEQAWEYVSLAEKIMGANWVTPKHFRIGTSRIF